MGVLQWRGDAARSSYEESVIIRALQQNQCMGKVGDNNHHHQCTVGKLVRIKDDVYLVAAVLMGGGLVYRLCPT
eukprot:scaffold15751_cov160-Skeletonema_dohrnii-CCMP3373.AAC.1